MLTHHCLFTPDLASAFRPLCPKGPREAVQTMSASVTMLHNHCCRILAAAGSITLHAANKTGTPIACCLASISICCTFWVCYCRLSQRCCLRGLWRRGPPSRSRPPSLTPQALQTLMMPPLSWSSGVQACLPIWVCHHATLSTTRQMRR